MVQNWKKPSKDSHLIIHFPQELGSEWASERVSAVERASHVSSAEQANEWGVQANEQMDEQVAQHLPLNSGLFWTLVYVKSGEKRVKSIKGLKAGVWYW